MNSLLPYSRSWVTRSFAGVSGTVAWGIDAFCLELLTLGTRGHYRLDQKTAHEKPLPPRVEFLVKSMKNYITASFSEVIFDTVHFYSVGRKIFLLIWAATTNDIRYTTRVVSDEMKTMVMMMIAHMILFTLDVLFSLPTLMPFPHRRGAWRDDCSYRLQDWIISPASYILYRNWNFLVHFIYTFHTSSIPFIGIMRRFMEVYTRRPILLSLSELNLVVVV